MAEEKASIYYLRGKVLDIKPNYEKDAEDSLSKSIKLNPFSWKTWDVLGHILWKKGNHEAALKSYNEAIEKVIFIENIIYIN